MKTPSYERMEVQKLLVVFPSLVSGTRNSSFWCIFDACSGEISFESGSPAELLVFHAKCQSWRKTRHDQSALPNFENLTIEGRVDWLRLSGGPNRKRGKEFLTFVDGRSLLRGKIVGVVWRSESCHFLAGIKRAFFCSVLSPFFHSSLGAFFLQSWFDCGWERGIDPVKVGHFLKVVLSAVSSLTRIQFARIYFAPFGRISDRSSDLPSVISNHVWIRLPKIFSSWFL